MGAGWATKLQSKGLYKIIATLLVVIAGVMISGHLVEGAGSPLLENSLQLALSGAAAGFAIGVVAALLGVAGGELLIPTLVILFGVDIKLAGSLSLAVSCQQCWSALLVTAVTGVFQYWELINLFSSSWQRGPSAAHGLVAGYSGLFLKLY